MGRIRVDEEKGREVGLESKRKTKAREGYEREEDDGKKERREEDVEMEE